MVGDTVKIKNGATSWMKERGYWLECMGENIDGEIGTVVGDYTYLKGDDSHYSLQMDFEYEIGVHPQFLEPI